MKAMTSMTEGTRILALATMFAVAGCASTGSATPQGTPAPTPAGSTTAPANGGQSRAPSWRLATLEHVDLWLHGFALLTSDTGHVPFFARGYKQRIIECGERCALQLPTGDYKLVLRDRQGTYWTQRLSVAMPMSAVVSPPDQGTRRLGIGLTMAGALAISAGYITFLVIAWKKYGESAADCIVSSCEREQFATSTYVIAGGSLAVGAALGATGLVLWRGSSHAVLRSNAPDAPAASTGAALSLTPAAGHRWAGLALMGRF